MPGASQQPGGDYRSDAVELAEAGAVLGEDPRHLGGDLLEAGVELSDLGIWARVRGGVGPGACPSAPIAVSDCGTTLMPHHRAPTRRPGAPFDARVRSDRVRS